MRRLVPVALVPVALALAMLMSLSTAAAAQAVATPFTSQIVTEEILDPGTTRVTPGGVMLLRGEVSAGTENITIDGEEFPGRLVMTNNVNLNLRTLQGSLSGKFVLEAPGLDTWTGNAQGVITNGVATGTFVGHGANGTKQMGTFTEVEPGVLDVEGTILTTPGATDRAILAPGQ